jgi:hypothetical protein
MSGGSLGSFLENEKSKAFIGENRDAFVAEILVNESRLFEAYVGVNGILREREQMGYWSGWTITTSP